MSRREQVMSRREQIRRRALRVARAFASAAERIEAAALGPDPLSAAREIGLGPAVSALKWLVTEDDARRRRRLPHRGTGTLAPGKGNSGHGKKAAGRRVRG